MELRHLRYFVGVAEDLHFGRAAARLGISQPPLSQQIMALESELGVQLFDRTSRAVTLTDAGTLFLREARATLAQAERAVIVARRAALGELGELAIGFNASAPFVPAVARAIHDFRIAYPEVHMTLSELSEDGLRSALAARSIEIGFLRSLREPELPPGAATRLLMREGLVVVMRPDHPLAARKAIGACDLDGQAMVVYQRGLIGGFTEDLLRLLSAGGAEPIIAQEVREVSTLFGLVAAGIGITIVARSLQALQSAGLVYRDFDAPDANSAMWIVHQQERLSEPARHFLEAVIPSRETRER
ncbi:LysR substrate-binding domain-containing protein [Sphingomonas crusticola]|uniref:LysR substrate-binding domain-containing protein n=1 Tax=Sphingomonas crusticola TaxID=1697973 RepID=UPI000E227C19|nr:LysR substrate-binding domain-containing protein [Sphingomonas crusticola]